MNNILRIARKEFAGFFSSPIAFIFLGAFLAVTLFVFFWVETFFARNIADVRPLFEWMPLLLATQHVGYLPAAPEPWGLVIEATMPGLTFLNQEKAIKGGTNCCGSGEEDKMSTYDLCILPKS